MTTQTESTIRKGKCTYKFGVEETQNANFEIVHVKNVYRCVQGLATNTGEEFRACFYVDGVLTDIVAWNTLIELEYGVMVYCGSDITKGE